MALLAIALLVKFFLQQKQRSTSASDEPLDMPVTKSTSVLQPVSAVGDENE